MAPILSMLAEVGLALLTLLSLTGAPWLTAILLTYVALWAWAALFALQLQLCRRVFALLMYGGELPDGNIRHVDVMASQMLAQPPNRQLSHHRTPIKGLYL